MTEEFADGLLVFRTPLDVGPKQNARQEEIGTLK
jgi:hypothetical protein